MKPVQDLSTIGGWLTVFAFLRIAGGILWTVLLLTGMRGLHSSVDYINLTSILLGCLAGLAVLNQWRSAIAIVGLHLAVSAALAPATIWFYRARLRQALPGIGFMIAFTLAWFLYFHFSLRVRLALGRNLLADASLNDDRT